MTASRTRSTGPYLARLAAVLLTSTMLSGVPQALAQTLPTGGSVAAGSASISTPTGGTLTVTQSSSSAVVNWQSFSVGQGNAVNFVQPSSTSAILNRVTGAATSTIAGQINANGQVYLVNPNGIAITSTGTVNAAGFVASTLGISDSDFMSGKRSFTGNGASAGVSNAGTITIGRGGYAALLGGSVDNAGTITVPLGKVGLGSGEQATLDLSGDGFLQVAVPTNAAGSNALVSNSGKISANGGSVQLSAAAARDMARQAINMSGTIEAKSVGGRNGAIILGGSEGAVAVSGKLNVASRKAKGGSITITGRDIKLAGATLDASGKTGGGSINIGGGRQGQGPLQRAETTSVDSATKIKADATGTGNGGNVVVWSDTRTDFAGSISATGGQNGGNGGEAEVSSHGVLAYTGMTILTAPMGQTGTLLLDPYNVTISNGTDSNSSGFTASANDSIINVGTLQTALATANVTISTGSSGTQAGDITIASPLSWSANLLRLDAAHSIKVAATVTVGGTGALMLNTNVGGGTGGIIDFGLTSAGFNGRIDFTGTPGQQALLLNGTQYTLVYSSTDLQNINNGLSGNYALAGNFDASGQTYTTGVIAGGDTSGNAPANAFAGTLAGLGHTVANLTINGGSSSYVGLIGYSTGTIRDIGLTGGAVSGAIAVGGLVGLNTGTISNVYATDSVSGFNNVGGLVGNSSGTISSAFATGPISANAIVGGLVGSSAGTISNSFATGAVSGGVQVGGLVGNQSGGSISNAFATGAVSGTSNVGGLVGQQASGTVTDAYYDINTTGLTSDAAGATGLTTAQLQNGTSASGLGSAFTLSAGLYPYLTGFFPNGVQAISGVAYADSGVTRYASNANATRYVYVDIAGQQIAVTTGANGYYYIALPAGTLSSANGGTAVVAYTRDGNVTGPVTGAHLTRATGTLGNIDVWAHTLIAPTTATSLSTAETNAAALLSANSGANQTLLTAAAGSDTVPSDATSGIAALTSVGYIATSSAGFTIDQGISAYGLYARTTSGPITIASAQTLGGPINVMLLSAGDININAPITLSTGGLTLASGGIVHFAAPVTVKGAGTVDIEASDYDFGLTNSGFTGALTYVNADGTPATSDQGGVLKINGQTYQLLYSLAAFDALDGEDALTTSGTGQIVSGNYAFARDFDGSGTTYINGLIDGTNFIGFDGTLTGLGHAISHLTINSGGLNNYVGLIGYLSGTVRDIGINGGTVGSQYTSEVGGLVGYLTNGAETGSHGQGIVRNAYSTAVVNGASSVGGLVGSSEYGSISNAWASGQVTGLGTAVGGLVGSSEYGSISKAHATGAVSTVDSSAGGLVGQSGHDTINDVYATGAVSGPSSIGGLVGNSEIGSITNAWASGNVTFTGTGYRAGTAVGGLVGMSESGTFTNVWASGNVTGAVTFTGDGLRDFNTGPGNFVGGLVGLSTLDSITGAYATGAVSGVGKVGGLVGSAIGTQISNAYATGHVTGNWYLGGLVGSASYSTSTSTYTLTNITNAYATGDVSGLGQYIGGLVGYNIGNITKAYASGAVSGTRDVGGLVGAVFNGQIANAYATGSATASLHDGGLMATFPDCPSCSVGGLVGGFYDSIGTITNAYATGAVSGPTDAGGLVGRFQGLQAINSYWNVETTGQTGGAGTVSNHFLAIFGTNGLTTAQMQDPFTFINAGWDFATVWGTSTTGANGGKPMLRAQSTGLYDDYVKLGSGTRVYGDANSTISGATLSGVGASNITLNWGSAVGVTANAGTYNYSDASVVSLSETGSRTAYLDTSGTLTISQRPLTVTADAKSKSYGDANPTLTYTASGFVNGDSLSGALSTTAGQNSDVGAYGIPQGTLGNSNYAINYTGADLTVTQRALTVVADAKSKTYGDANPALTYTASGLVNGDTVSGSLSTSAAQYSNAGDYAITSSLTASSNYALTYTGANLTVTPRPVTITADAKSSVYGADVVDPFHLTYTIGGRGFVHGDGLSGTLSTTASPVADAGNYPIVQGTLAASSNYALTFIGANYTIMPRVVFVTADAKSRTYGDSNPALSYTSEPIRPGDTGLVNGDTLSGALTTAAGQFSNVGTYAISQGTLGNPNYTISYTGADLTVTPRALTVTADAKSRTYGDANPALTYTANGLLNNDSLSGSLATAGQFANVGTYAITQGTLGNSNYTISYTGANMTIDRRDLIVQANGQTRAYGDANPTFTYTPSDLVNGDQLTGSLSTAANQASGIGTYTIDRGSLAASSNYTLTYAGANLTVTPRPLTVTADAKSRSYGDTNPALTYTASGLVNGDTVTGSLSTGALQNSNVGNYAITGAFTASNNYALTFTDGTLTVTPRLVTVTADAKSKIYGDANPALTYTATGLLNGDAVTGSLSTAAVQYSNVGDYAITGSFTAPNSNYALTYAGANLTVTPRPITVTADAKSKIYGDANPALTFTANGLLNGDTLTGALTVAAGQYANVGSYAITLNASANPNYTVNYTGANLSITPRPIIVTADTKSKIYGDVNPTLTYTVGERGLVNGDLLFGALATDADSNSIAGRYGITRGSLQASANYAMTFVPGTLTVDAVINPPATEIASTLANNPPAGATITPAMLPVIVSPPSATSSADGSGPTVLSVDPRFDGVVICSGLNCVVAR